MVENETSGEKFSLTYGHTHQSWRATNKPQSVLANQESTWVTVEEAEITHCYLRLDVEKGCECVWRNVVGMLFVKEHLVNGSAP